MESWGSLLTDESLDPLGRKKNLSTSPIDSYQNLTAGTPLSGTMPGNVSPSGSFGGPISPPTPTKGSPRSMFDVTQPSSGPPFSGGGSNVGTAPSTSSSPSSPNPANLPFADPINTSSNNLQNVLGQTYNWDIANQSNLLNENENALNFDNVTSSPLYKANLTGANESTASAYDQAVTNAKANANSRGFGYASPVEQGAETGIRGQEAGQMGRNPSSALLQTITPLLEAAQIRSGEMSQFSPNPLLSSWAGLAAGKSQSQAALYAALLQALSSTGNTVLQQNPGGVFGPSSPTPTPTFPGY